MKGICAFIMSKSFRPLIKKEVMHLEKLKQKKCAFPKCSVLFKGTGKSKYCLEHRKPKYRKIIDAAKIQAKIKLQTDLNSNQTIEHSFKESTFINCQCQLNGCKNIFDITVFPGVFIYPKYCLEHRNEYKRKFYLSQQTAEKTYECVNADCGWTGQWKDCLTFKHGPEYLMCPECNEHVEAI